MAHDLERIDVSHLDALARIEADQRAIRALIEKAAWHRDKVVEVYSRVVRDYEAAIKALDEQAAAVRQRVREDLGVAGRAARAVPRGRGPGARRTAGERVPPRDRRVHARGVPAAAAGDRAHDRRAAGRIREREEAAPALRRAAAGGHGRARRRICPPSLRHRPHRPPAAAARRRSAAGPAVRPPPPACRRPAPLRPAPPPGTGGRAAAGGGADSARRGCDQLPAAAVEHRVPAAPVAGRRRRRAVRHRGRRRGDAHRGPERACPASTTGSACRPRIGRTADNQIVVPIREVSRRHAEIVLDETGYLIRDLGFAERHLRQR